MTTQQLLHKTRRQQGLCVRCGQPAFIHLHGPQKGQPAHLCAQHKEERRLAGRAAYAAKHPLARPRKRGDTPRPPAAEQRQQGLCVWCREPAFIYPDGPRQGQTSNMCARHMELRRTAKRAAYVARHPNARPARPPSSPGPGGRTPSARPLRQVRRAGLRSPHRRMAG